MKVLQFGAEHCPQCRVLRPRVEEWCRQRQIDYTYWDVESDESVDVFMEHEIRSIPTVVVVNGGKTLTVRGIDGWNEFIKEK